MSGGDSCTDRPFVSGAVRRVAPGVRWRGRRERWGKPGWPVMARLEDAN